MNTLYRYFRQLGMAGLLLPISVLTISCKDSNEHADAYGNFEVEETTISAQANGELLAFTIEEGNQLAQGEVVGRIDTTQLAIQKAEIKANIAAINANKSSVAAEQKVIEIELKNAERELLRVKQLVASQAATQKQLDDMEGNIEVLNSRKAAVATKYASINAQAKALAAKIDLIDDQIARCQVTNPVNGLVLTKLARQNELVAAGKPLYKIADMSKIYLRAYVAEVQLASFKTGQTVSVFIDSGEGLKEYPGTISWVSSDAEFTPKIIQTKDERVNLVYAIKVSVKNDGSLKIGMPGEVRFK